MGDVFQFMRFLPLVKAQARRLVFACQKAMQPILRPTPCVDEWFPIDEPANINFDVYAPLLSLPGLLGIDENNIAQRIPYVFPDPVRLERWCKPIQALPGRLKVGICWQGSPTFAGDRLRSIPLKHFAPLGQIPSVTLISLQTRAGLEQIEPNRQIVPLHVLGELDREGAFVDRAAVLSHLDLVITCDTSLGHLAGAMGRPAWVLLPVGCDWRWLTDRSDSPWYPTVRLFRQKSLGDWSEVFREIAMQMRLSST
jgi:ADP-heptose:LPS heptosyltransferase